MIVVPKPNPLNINRLGHAHSHRYSVPHVPTSMVPSSTAAPAPVIVQTQKRARNPNNRTLAQSNPPKSPSDNYYSHKHSNSRTSFPTNSPSPINVSSFHPTPQLNTYKYRQRHTSNSYSTKNYYPYSPSQLVGAGPEFEMALDLSDMSPTSPSPASRTPSPTSFSPISPVHGSGTRFFPSYPSSGNLFAASFPTTPAPAPIPIRLAHTRAPSAPVLPHHTQTHTHTASYSPSSSFEHERYASSTWQNSPPAASLPKPKFLDNDVFN